MAKKKNSGSGSDTFRWIPGMAASNDAIARMRSRFHKPRKPTGEAWFMGDRKMYTELMSQSLSDLPCDYFQKVLFEITGGKNAFPGMVAPEKWKEWLQFLLPELALRAHEKHIFYLLEELVTAFAVYFERSPDEEYAGFRQDAINSLGVAIMSSSLWHPPQTEEAMPSKKIPRFLLEEYKSYVNKLVGRRNVSGAVSSAMFFCLKYLEPIDMASWVDSIITIENSHWRAAILNWFIGAQGFLADLSLNTLEDAAPKIAWSNSFLLKSAREPLIPKDNASAFSEQIRNSLTNDLLANWEEQLTQEKQFFIEPQDNQIASIESLFSEVRQIAKS